VLIFSTVAIYIVAFSDRDISRFKPPHLDPIARSVFERYYEVASRYESLNFERNRFVSVLDILALICAESGGEVHRGMSNDEIIGDSWRSFGVMQVSDEALEDVNESLGTDYRLSDLLDSVEVNILVGSHYFQLCIEQALEEGSRNPKYLAVVKYNSGVKNADDRDIDDSFHLSKWLRYRDELKKVVRFNGILYPDR
jgi:hypothetical protein